MDTTDPHITFDDKGNCCHCTDLKRRQDLLGSLEERRHMLASLVSQIRAKGKKLKYDCIIGISGGLDSSYVALKCKEFGLRPLAVHFDNGWNSEISVNNIENTIRKLDIDLETHVMDWEQFRDLQLAFLKSGTPDIEIPTDHGILSCLYDVALKHRVRYILSGSNLFTEGICPDSWSWGYNDWKYIRYIHRRFGQGNLLSSYPRCSLLKMVYMFGIKWIQRISLLNYYDYTQSEMLQEVKKKLNYREYGKKHYESIFTRFFQSYILPKKFGYDKRRSHFSVLIVSGQLSREQALEKLEEPICDSNLMEEDKELVMKKLRLTEEDWQAIMKAPIMSTEDYPNNKRLFRMLLPAFHVVKKYQ